MQLDLFKQSDNVILENAVISAFSSHDLKAAKTAITALRNKYPQQQRLNLYDILLVQLEDFAEARRNKQLAECCQRLNELIQPVGHSLYGGEHARRWAAPLWQQLAELAAAQPFDPSNASYHAAPLWLSAGDDGMARTATETIPSWRKIPLPLAWMTEIELRAGHPEIYWPLLAELAWLAPQRLAHLLEHAPATVNGFFNRFSNDFENNSDEEDLTWFPAWLLICAPELREFLRATPAGNTPPAQTFTHLRDLLQLEKAGQQAGLIALRGKLRGLAPDIFTIYMRSR
jgi:hypothetical protein